MIRLLLLALAAQLADLLTYSPGNERNEFVLALGANAPSMKLALCALLMCVAVVSPDGNTRRQRLNRIACKFALWAAAVFGVVGALSNL